MTTSRYRIRAVNLDGADIPVVSAELAASRDHLGRASWEVRLVIAGPADPPLQPTMRAVLENGRSVTGRSIRKDSVLRAGPGGVSTTVLLLGNGPLEGIYL